MILMPVVLPVCVTLLTLNSLSCHPHLCRRDRRYASSFFVSVSLPTRRQAILSFAACRAVREGRVTEGAAKSVFSPELNSSLTHIPDPLEQTDREASMTCITRSHHR